MGELFAQLGAGLLELGTTKSTTLILIKKVKAKIGTIISSCKKQSERKEWSLNYYMPADAWGHPKKNLITQ